MIAMVIGLMILSAVLYVFSGNSASYRHQESLSRVQESGRFALELFTRDIRMAGFAGCGNLAYVENLTPAAFSNANAITGTTNPVSISIRNAGMRTATLSSMPADNSSLEIDDLNLLAIDPENDLQGRQIVVTDCAFMETFSVDAVNADAGTLSPPAGSPLIRTYQPSTQVMMFGGTTTYDLVGTTLRQNAQPIIEGVTNMQITYGIDANGDRQVDAYVANPADWTRVMAVRVSLTIQDGDVMLPFDTTVTLRNRVP